MIPVHHTATLVYIHTTRGSYVGVPDRVMEPIGGFLPSVQTCIMNRPENHQIAVRVDAIVGLSGVQSEP